MKSKLLKDALLKFNSVENTPGSSDLEVITKEEAFKVVGGTAAVTHNCGTWGGSCGTWGGTCGTW